MKICIDAGHSGSTNPYSVNGKVIGWESEMSWKLHNKLASKLKAAGADVVFTRSKFADDPTLEARGKTAKGCGLFLSIHSNAASNSTTDYPLACVSVDGSADVLGMKLAHTVASVMQTKQAGRIWKKLIETEAGPIITTETDPNFGKDLGGRDWFGVIRAAASVGVPGILLECSFHTNPARAQWLVNDSNLDVLATALCDTIVKHYGISTGSVAADEYNTLLEWYEALQAKYDALVSALEALVTKYGGE